MLYACSAGSPTSPSDFFFFNDTATTEIYTLSLHDALPISESTVGLGGLVGHLLHRCGHVRPLHVLHLQTAQHRNDATVEIGRDTSELQSHTDLVCRLLLVKKNIPTEAAPADALLYLKTGAL